MTRPAHSPWQRGTCKNANGLLRHYLPERTYLAIYSQDQRDAIADQVNRRPHERHDFRSPTQAYQDVLQARSQTRFIVER